MNYTFWSPQVSTPAVSLSGISVMPSSELEPFTLANAGARPADRDAVDTRIVNDVIDRTGTIISSQNEVGGWPSLAVNTRRLTVPENPHRTTGSGYTVLEQWLHGYARIVEGTSSKLPPTPNNFRVVVAKETLSK
jgi:hypothetical protein